MSHPAAQPQAEHTGLSIAYADADALPGLLADDTVLAVLGFGPQAPHHQDPRWLRVPLAPHGSAPVEVWRGTRPVVRGRDGAIAWASNGVLQFGAIEVAEGQAGIEAASAHAYAALRAFVAASATPHLLRVWNYLDAVTEGEGDEERYRRFCVGRVRGLGPVEDLRLPAATAIGRVDGVRTLQVYWLASARPGSPLENPRQVSAYRYPRQYGPQAPSFARAMLPPPQLDAPLLLSGTAAVVGHQSLHADSTAAQLGETFANFAALLQAAREREPALPPRFGAHSPLKVYVRQGEELPLVAQLLERHLDPSVPRLLLHAAVCRRDLRIEIDGAHGP